MKRSFEPAPIFRILLFSLVFLVYGFADGQNSFAVPASYNYGGENNEMTSNVPLNEINVHAYRHFLKNFPAISNEHWMKNDGGYIVSFTKNGQRSQVHYNPRGAFLYTVTYYAGTSIARETGKQIERKYPDYRIGVVTEFSDGNRIFLMVKLENPSSIKTISICDGKMDLVEDLINGG